MLAYETTIGAFGVMIFCEMAFVAVTIRQNDTKTSFESRCKVFTFKTRDFERLSPSVWQLNY